MFLQTPLIFFLLANVVDANVFSRGSESIMRAADNARHRAIKRSTGLLRDLRLAYTGLLVQQAGSSDKMYCINVQSNTSLTGGNNGPGISVGPSGTRSASSPVATGGTTVTSPWKLAQSYVCAIPF